MTHKFTNNKTSTVKLMRCLKTIVVSTIGNRHTFNCTVRLYSKVQATESNTVYNDFARTENRWNRSICHQLCDIATYEVGHPLLGVTGSQFLFPRSDSVKTSLLHVFDRSVDIAFCVIGMANLTIENPAVVAALILRAEMWIMKWCLVQETKCLWENTFRI